MIEYFCLLKTIVLLLLGGVSYGLYQNFRIDSLGFEAKNIDLKDIGRNH